MKVRTKQHQNHNFQIADCWSNGTSVIRGFGRLRAEQRSVELFFHIWESQVTFVKSDITSDIFTLTQK